MKTENKTEEMINPIVITMNDINERYELDFDHDAVLFAEQRGFSTDDIDRYAATKIPELFWYSFRKNHKRITKAQSDGIIVKIGGLTTAIVERLIKLYNQAAFTGYFSDDEESKNPNVTVEL